MDKLILFIAEQWLLVGGLLSCAMLLMYHDARRSGRAITAQQMVGLVNADGAVLIDLRDKAEFNKGHVVDAVNVLPTALDAEIERLLKTKEQPVVLMCKLGQHASAAGKKLSAKGYSQVYRLKGGVTDWQAQQLPLVK